VRQLVARGVQRVILEVERPDEDAAPWALLLRRDGIVGPGEAALGQAMSAGRTPAAAGPGVALEVEVEPSAGSGAPAAGRLLGHGLYDAGALDDWAAAGFSPPRAPPPRVRVVDEASRRRAERAVWASIRKSLSHDGPVAYYLARPLSRPLTRALALAPWVPRPVSPNAVTALGLAVALGGGAVAALGGYWAGVAAAGLFFLGLLLDCVDGDLARVTLTTSRRGQWLDTVTDDLSYAALAVGFGVGLWREGGGGGLGAARGLESGGSGGGPGWGGWGGGGLDWAALWVDGSPAPWLWLALGLATLAMIVVGQAVIYVHLWRSGGPVDTARYPWFFMGDEGLAQSERRSVVGWLSFAVRRDSLTVYFVILALADVRGAILVLLFAGSALYFVLLGVDLVVKAVRGVKRRA
jgi:hypothetical protein